MATVIVDGDGGNGSGTAAHSNTAAWVIVSALAGVALLAFATPLGGEAEASYWYGLGAALPAERQTAITHLQAMEKTATGSLLTLIQRDVAALQKLGNANATSHSKGG